MMRRIGEPPGTRPLENLLQRLARTGTCRQGSTPTPRPSASWATSGRHHFGRGPAVDVYQSLTQLMPILEW